MVANVGETWPANELERALEAAEHNPEASKDVERLLLETELYVVGEPDPPAPVGEFVADDNCKVAMLNVHGPDGTMGIAVFTSLGVLNSAAREPVRYMRMRGDALLGIAAASRIHINPYGPHGVTVAARDTDPAISGDGFVEIPQGSDLLIGKPARALTAETVAEIRARLARLPRVARAFWVAVQIPRLQDPSGYAIMIVGGSSTEVGRHLHDIMDRLSTAYTCPMYVLDERKLINGMQPVTEHGTLIYRRPWWKWMPQKTWR